MNEDEFDDESSDDGVPPAWEDVHGDKEEDDDGVSDKGFDQVLEDVGPPMHPEQAGIVKLAIAGHNVFYTGPAGCGKSFVLQRIRSELVRRGKKVTVVVPTGIAAHGIGGTTIHSFLRLTPDDLKKKKVQHLLSMYSPGSSRAADLTEPDALIIDEISMVSNQTLSRMSDILKQARADRRPFGGLQVIATGDFYQLPPIKPFEYCCEIACKAHPDNWNPTEYRCMGCRAMYLDEDKWAFRGSAWHDAAFRLCRLETIHRQKDQEFLQVLNKVRAGTPLTSKDQTLLMRHPCDVKDAIKLMSTNKDVKQANTEGMRSLPGPEHDYTCYDNFKETKGHEGRYEEYKKSEDFHEDGISVKIRSKLKDHRYAAIIKFKKGARVILLSNLDRARGLCNGSQGTIVDFEPYDEKKLPSKENGKLGPIHGGHKAGHINEFCKAQAKRQGCWPWFPIVLFENGTKETIYPECTVQEIGHGVRQKGSGEIRYSLLCRTQLPLAAAWAITIHKAQGMTLSKAIVYLKSIQKGQMLYVALSRVQELKGLKIEGPQYRLNECIARCMEVERFYGTLRPVGEFAGALPADGADGNGPGEEEKDFEEDYEEELNIEYERGYD